MSWGELSCIFYMGSFRNEDRPEKCKPTLYTCNQRCPAYKSVRDINMSQREILCRNFKGGE
jgi:hypothetical protein